MERRHEDVAFEGFMSGQLLRIAEAIRSRPKLHRLIDAARETVDPELAELLIKLRDLPKQREEFQERFRQRFHEGGSAQTSRTSREEQEPNK
jgi:CRISPR/Cas system-associated endonuclease Cas3-HD